MDLETMRQAIEDHELEEAQRLVVELRRMVVKLDLAIANYADVLREVQSAQGVTGGGTACFAPRARAVPPRHNEDA